MRRPEGHDWIGVALFTFGILLAAAGIALTLTGQPEAIVAGLFAVAVAALNDFVIGYELWGTLRR